MIRQFDALKGSPYNASMALFLICSQCAIAQCQWLESAVDPQCQHSAGSAGEQIQTDCEQAEVG